MQPKTFFRKSALTIAVLIAFGFLALLGSIVRHLTSL
jgi:hypothetical protein